MAKKTTKKTEFSVVDKLKALYELQIIDSQIDKLRIVRGELPLEVKDLEDTIEGLKTRLQNIEDDISKKEDFISSKKIAIDDSNKLVEKYNKQLDNIKNNREYDSLNKEIEFQNLEIELAEKKIKDSLAKIEFDNQNKEKTQEQINEKTELLDEKNKELKKIISATEKEEKDLISRSQKASKIVDERLLLTYNRIRKSKKNGLAVVSVERDACGGCFSKIPPQKQLDIKSHKKIIFCEHCGRILIDADILDPEKKD